MNQDIVNISKLADAALELANAQETAAKSGLPASPENWEQVCKDTVAQMGISDEFRHLRDSFGLSNEMLATIALVLLPEIDNRYIDFFAALTGSQDPVPTIDTVTSLVTTDFNTKSALITGLNASSPLIFWDLLSTGEGKSPAQKKILAESPLISFVAGNLNPPPGDLLSACAASPLNIAADSGITALRNQFQIICGGFPERQLTVAIRLAKNFHNQPLFRLNTEILDGEKDPETSLRDSLLYLLLQKSLLYWQDALNILDTNPAWVKYVNAWLNVKSTILFAGESEAEALPPSLNPFLVGTISLSPLSPEMNKDIWQSMGNALLGNNTVDWNKISNAYTMDMKRIGQTMMRIKQSGATMNTASLQNAYIASSPSVLNDCARLIEPETNLSDLVLSGVTESQINHFFLQFKSRPARADGSISGLYAILEGPPGTGKTMAAKGIAAQLRLPLYLFDPSHIESGNNSSLSSFFAEAKANSAALLFDEADSLFAYKTSASGPGKTIVASLIQEIENYDGIALLTTNNKDRVDPAFIRRASSVISFPEFSPVQRLTLFRKLVSDSGASLDPNASLNWLTGATPFTGRHISNIVSNAILSAKARNPQTEKTVISNDDLLYAIRKEFK